MIKKDILVIPLYIRRNKVTVSFKQRRNVKTSYNNKRTSRDVYYYIRTEKVCKQSQVGS